MLQIFHRFLILFHHFLKHPLKIIIKLFFNCTHFEGNFLPMKRSRKQMKTRAERTLKEEQRLENKEYVRFEEKMHLLEEAARKKLKKQKKSAEDVQDFNRFFPIPKLSTLKLYNYKDSTDALLAEFNMKYYSNNNENEEIETRGEDMDFQELVSSFFDDFTLDALIEENLFRCLPQKFPLDLSGKDQGILFYSISILF